MTPVEFFIYLALVFAVFGVLELVAQSADRRRRRRLREQHRMDGTGPYRETYRLRIPPREW